MANFNFNKVILGGRLTANPELKTTPSGISVVSFSVAVDRRFGNKGEEKQTDFINVSAWRQTAEFVCKYFTKGSSICVVGSLQSRSYEKDGQKRTVFEVVADECSFVDGKNDNAPVSDHTPAAAAPKYVPDYDNQQNVLDEEIDGNEELPF